MLLHRLKTNFFYKNYMKVYWNIFSLYSTEQLHEILSRVFEDPTK